jgi:hypothetical protein
LIARETDSPSAVDKIVLVYALAIKPLSFVDSRLVGELVGPPRAARVVIAESVARLEAAGLIIVRRRGSILRYRRTEAGVALAYRLLRDRRLSFVRALVAAQRAVSE